jgi:hypothetical protein
LVESLGSPELLNEQELPPKSSPYERYRVLTTAGDVRATDVGSAVVSGSVKAALQAPSAKRHRSIPLELPYAPIDDHFPDTEWLSGLIKSTLVNIMEIKRPSV